MPKMEKVYLHNPSSEEISLISISATTAHFHASFFQNRVSTHHFVHLLLEKRLKSPLIRSPMAALIALCYVIIMLIMRQVLTVAAWCNYCKWDIWTPIKSHMIVSSQTQTRAVDKRVNGKRVNTNNNVGCPDASHMCGPSMWPPRALESLDELQSTKGQVATEPNSKQNWKRNATVSSYRCTHSLKMTHLVSGVLIKKKL